VDTPKASVRGPHATPLCERRPTRTGNQQANRQVVRDKEQVTVLQASSGIERGGDASAGDRLEGFSARRGRCLSLPGSQFARVPAPDIGHGETTEEAEVDLLNTVIDADVVLRESKHSGFTSSSQRRNHNRGEVTGDKALSPT
jgi:hypothetical protein